jgi:hypothetical protein
MTSRPRALGGYIPPMPAPGVGYGVRVLNLSPFQTEWYAANVSYVTSVSGKTGAVTLYHTDINDWNATLAPYALLNGPAFIGTPTAPTQPVADSSTLLATTAFVHSAVTSSVGGVASFNTRTGAVTLSQADVTAVLPAGTTLPLMDGVAAAGAANSWSRSDHKHPTDTSLVPISGGVTMTGPLTLSAAPVNPNDAATKAYTDSVYVDMGTY